MTEFEELQEEIPMQFRITMIGPSRYELADSKTGEFFELKKISQLYSKVYKSFLLKLDNGSKRYAFFEFDTKTTEYKIYCSDPFEELIQEFTESILVKTYQGEKKLIRHHTTQFLDWQDYSSKSHEIKTLTNGHKVILRNDFELSSEFKDVILHCKEESTRDYQVRIVTELGEQNHMAVIRIQDFETLHVSEASYIGKDEEYIKLKLLDGKEAILRTGDFEISDSHKVVEIYEKYGFAFTSDDGKNFNVLHLSDFGTASFSH